MVPQGHVLRGGRVGVELQPGGRCIPTRLRSILWLTSGHCLDDFNGVEFTDLAESARQTFADLFALLGLRTKQSLQVPTTGRGTRDPRGALSAHHPKGDTGTDRQHLDAGGLGRRLPQPHGRTEAGRTPVIPDSGHFRVRRQGGHQTDLRATDTRTQRGPPGTTGPPTSIQPRFVPLWPDGKRLGPRPPLQRPNMVRPRGGHTDPPEHPRVSQGVHLRLGDRGPGHCLGVLRPEATDLMDRLH